MYQGIPIRDFMFESLELQDSICEFLQNRSTDYEKPSTSRLIPARSEKRKREGKKKKKKEKKGER